MYKNIQLKHVQIWSTATVCQEPTVCLCELLRRKRNREFPAVHGKLESFSCMETRSRRGVGRSAGGLKTESARERCWEGQAQRHRRKIRFWSFIVDDDASDLRIRIFESNSFEIGQRKARILEECILVTKTIFQRSLGANKADINHLTKNTEKITT